MKVEEAKKTIEKLYDVHKYVMSDKVKELVDAQKAKLDDPECSYSDVRHVGIVVSNLLTKREYRNVDFSGKPDFEPARTVWKEIPVQEAIRRLEQKDTKEIKVIFYDDLGKKHHFSTEKFDIMFYDTGSFSEVWYNVAYLRE